MVVILVIHCLIAAILVGAILLQKKEGGLGGLGGGGSGGMGGMMSGRAKSDLLSRTTGFLAAAFFVTSLALAVIGARTTHQGPLVPATSSAPTAPAESPAAPATGAVEGSAPVESAPESAPAQPATPAVPAGQ
jgi:preprotein translocase subunit SecG